MICDWLTIMPAPPPVEVFERESYSQQEKIRMTTKGLN